MTMGREGGGLKRECVRGSVLLGGVWVQTCSCEYSKGVRNKNKRAFKAGRAWRGSRMSERGHKRGLSGGEGGRGPRRLFFSVQWYQEHAARLLRASARQRVPPQIKGIHFLCNHLLAPPLV